MRTRFSISVELSSTTDEMRDIGKLSAAHLDDTVPEGASFKVRVAGGAGPVLLAPAALGTIKLLALRTYAVDPTRDLGVIEIRLGDVGADPLEVRPIGNLNEGALLLTTSVDSVYASNPGTVDAFVVGAFAGE